MKPFTPEYINPRMLETFLRQPHLINEKRNLTQDETDQNMYLYKYDVECDYFIIILDGSAIVKVGKEGMEINANLFSYFGIDALKPGNDIAGLRLHNSLSNNNMSTPVVMISISETDLSANNNNNNNTHENLLYKPEFSLIVNSYCVYLKVTRSQWADAVTKSMMERYHHGGQLPGSSKQTHITTHLA